MKKFCIFCGKSPIKYKNCEHVIPTWLIKHTGKPKRKVYLGVDWKKVIKLDKNEKTKSLRFYSFNKFKFPSCQSCNDEFSALESKTKPAVIDLLDENALSSDQIDTILDWFDKVRVGLWLSFLQLNENIMRINPNFHISDRVGRSDRALFIYKLEEISDGINFLGADLPSFQLMPSFFGLRINRFYFTNVSTDFLISKNLGLPYFESRDIFYLSRKHVFGFNPERIKHGKEHLDYPFIKDSYNKCCTEIYQPIIKPECIKDNRKKLYEKEYVKKILDISKSLKGSILIKSDDRIIEYPKNPDIMWIPQNTNISKKEFILKLFSQSLDIPNNMLKNSLSCTFANKLKKEKYKEQIESCIEFNRGIKSYLG